MKVTAVVITNRSITLENMENDESDEEDNRNLIEYTSEDKKKIVNKQKNNFITDISSMDLQRLEE